MAARRRRRNSIRRRRVARGGSVLPVILCILLTPVAVLVAITVFFKVSTIGVSGESRYAAQDIIAASGIKTGENMFRFNKFEAIESIFADMPYLDEISIRRKLPDTVSIIVSSCVPAAVIESGEQKFLMDVKGKLLEECAEAPAGYTVITGAELSNPQVGKYVKFVDQEKEKPLFLVLNTLKKNDILLYVGNLDISKTYNIKLTYKQFTVALGTGEQAEKKIRFMLLVADEKLSESDRGMIDVSDGKTARFIPR